MQELFLGKETVSYWRASYPSFRSVLREGLHCLYQQRHGETMVYLLLADLGLFLQEDLQFDKLVVAMRTVFPEDTLVTDAETTRLTEHRHLLLVLGAMSREREREECHYQAF